MLKLAQKVADEDFEPFVDNARELVSDYNSKLHKALEDTSIWYEVDDGLFWQANFDVAAYLNEIEVRWRRARTFARAFTAPQIYFAPRITGAHADRLV